MFSFESRYANAMGTFKKAQVSLQTLLQDLGKAKADVSSKIAKLGDEHENLAKQEDQARNSLAKISEFLGP